MALRTVIMEMLMNRGGGQFPSPSLTKSHENLVKTMDTPTNKHCCLYTLENKSVGADPDKPKCRKAKEIRMERKRQKLAARGMEEVC